MNEQIYDDLNLEKVIKAQFGVAMEIDSVIARKFAVSRSGNATLFLTSKKQLYVYIASQSRTLLSDIKKIVSRIGLRAEIYLPPKGRPHYFDEIGQQKFREVFPGRGNVSDIDVAYYRTLAPYNPALVLVGEVRDGHVYCFDSDASGGWRPVATFSYRRIRTS